MLKKENIIVQPLQPLEQEKVILIPLEEYKELLITKGKYEEIKSKK